MRTIVELFIRWIHLIAGMIWFGGILFSAIIPSILQRNLPLVESLQHISAIRNRLRPIIRITIHVLLITGAMNFFIVGWNIEMHFSSKYMMVFIVKLGFVGLMTLFHGLHLSVFGRKLEAAVAELKPEDTTVPVSIVKLQTQALLAAILTIFSGLVVFALALSLKGA